MSRNDGGRPLVRAMAGLGVLLLLVSMRDLTARAQSNRITLSLQDAIERTLDSSARLRDVRARGVAADASVRGAQAADLPRLTLLGGFTRTNHVDEFGVPQPDGRLRVIFPDLPTNYQARMDAQWPLYSSGRVAALERSALSDRDATRYEERSTRADLVLEVTRTYWSAVAGLLASDVIMASVGRLDVHLADVKARFAAGLVPPNDITTVEAQRASEHATLIESQLHTDQQLLLLKHLVGLPLSAQLDLSEPLVDSGSATAPAVPSPEARLQVSARPEVLGLEARAAAAGARAQAAAAERGPAVAIAGGVDLARPNAKRFPRNDIWQHSWDIGVQVSWSLFDAGRIDARRAAAVATEAALREQRGELEGRLAVEIAQRQLEVTAATARVRATETGVEAARETLRVVNARFAAGVATNTDIIDAETALLRAELDRSRAVVNTRLAAAQLQRALAR